MVFWLSAAKLTATTTVNERQAALHRTMTKAEMFSFGTVVLSSLKLLV